MDQFEHIGRQTATRRGVMRGAAVLAGGGLFGVALNRVALGQASAATGFLPQAVYIATEYAFEGPTQLTAGLNRLILRNDGGMEHHAMFLKLSEGKTAADLATAAQQGLGELLAIAPSVGGPGSIGPGRASTAVLDLEAGDYVVVCLVPDADGVPHLAKGMVLPVTVAEGSATPAAGVAAPVAELTLELEDFAFADLPETVPSGSKIWEVVNAGQQLHEVVIYQMAMGVTQAQIEAIFGITADASAASPMAGMDMAADTPAAEASPAAAVAPFTAVSGMAPMNPGMSGWIQFDVAAGNYFAICFIPDAATGAPHFMLGMIKFFTVE